MKSWLEPLSYYRFVANIIYFILHINLSTGHTKNKQTNKQTKQIKTKQNKKKQFVAQTLKMQLILGIITNRRNQVGKM